MFKAPRIAGNQEYRQKFLDNISFYFDPVKVVSKGNLEFIHKNWTVNFTDEKSQSSSVSQEMSSLYMRIKSLIVSLIKTESLD